VVSGTAPPLSGSLADVPWHAQTCASAGFKLAAWLCECLLLASTSLTLIVSTNPILYTYKHLYNCSTVPAASPAASSCCRARPAAAAPLRVPWLVCTCWCCPWVYVSTSSTQLSSMVLPDRCCCLMACRQETTGTHQLSG
jgi:hypothetical protein